MTDLPACVPDCKADSAKADAAYSRYCVLRRAQAGDPTLEDEESFQLLVSDAWASFITAFDNLSADA